MFTTHDTPTPLDVARMSHRNDAHTSQDAAEATAKSPKRELLYGAIKAALAGHPGTPAEVLDRYTLQRMEIGWLPEADLQDIRRRMTELEHDAKVIEPIVVGTHRNGRPQYATREGQRVMRLTEAGAA